MSWPDAGWGQYPCETCGEFYDVRGQCGCELTPIAATFDTKTATLGIPKVKKERKPKAAPKVARGFKSLKGHKIGTVIADAVNQVTLICGDAYFVIDVEVVGGIPVMKCKKHKVRKYKRPVTTAGGHAINKFGTIK